MSLVLGNGISVEGEFIDLRIAAETLPTGKQWYQIRHSDDDDMEAASLKRGCVAEFLWNVHLRPYRGHGGRRGG